MSRKVRNRAALLYTLALTILLAPLLYAAWQSDMSRGYVALLIAWCVLGALAIGITVSDAVARALFYRRYDDGQ